MILEFDNFKFKKDINTTIRRGIKNLSVNQTVLLLDKHTAQSCFAKIYSVKYKRFCDLKDTDIINEHDTFGRKYDSLTQIMRSTYDNFDTTEIITLIDFKLDKA